MKGRGYQAQYAYYNDYQVHALLRCSHRFLDRRQVGPPHLSRVARQRYALALGAGRRVWRGAVCCAREAGVRERFAAGRWLYAREYERGAQQRNGFGRLVYHCCHGVSELCQHVRKVCGGVTVMLVGQDRGCNGPHACCCWWRHAKLWLGTTQRMHATPTHTHDISLPSITAIASTTRAVQHHHGVQQEERAHGLPARHTHGRRRRTRLYALFPSRMLTSTQPLIAYFVIRNLLARLDPEAQQKEEARAKASAANRKLDAILSGKRRKTSTRGDYDSDDDSERRSLRPRIQDLNLNTYEQTIAMEVVAPEEIPISFEGTLHPPPSPSPKPNPANST